MEDIEPVRGILGDIAHISDGNLRKALFTTEVLALRELLGDRENLHRLLTMISTNEVQRMIEAALRGQVVEWRWEKDGYKNTRKLNGALGIDDDIISQQRLGAGAPCPRACHGLGYRPPRCCRAMPARSLGRTPYPR